MTDTAAFQNRLLDMAAHAAEVSCIHLGGRLGFYRDLANGPRTAAALAKATKTDPRYVTEWLEQQVVAGILTTDASRPPDERLFVLSPAMVPVLADRESLDYLMPLADLCVATAGPIERLAEAFRTGDGVPYIAYGDLFVAGQGDQNRAMLLQLLGREWLPRLPAVDAALRRPGARIADVGCGVGWSCIGMAQSYSDARVHGFDLDERSVQAAKKNVAAAGLEGRVQVHVRDAADPRAQHQYDLVTAFECIHDLSDPVGVLAAMRGMCKPDGHVLIMDENTGASLAEPGPFDRIFYAWSVLHCLPVGRSATPSAATGTVMRTETLQRYAREAGFRDAAVAPIPNDFFRFYLLTP